MRLIDKDKTLEELNGGYEQSLGIIEGSRYSNINSIEDAIDTVKYADEIDISKHDTNLLDKVAERFIEKYDLKYGQIEKFREMLNEVITELKAEVKECVNQ